MARKRDGLVPIGEALADLSGPVAALRDRDPAPVVVDGELAEDEGDGLRPPAQGHPDARRELGRRERLDHVVLGAGL